VTNIVDHEAGHIAMSAVLGAPVHYATVINDGMGLLGQVHTSGQGPIERIITGLAGQLRGGDTLPEWDHITHHPVGSDERDIAALVSEWDIDRKTYEKTVDITLRLMQTKEFDRIARLAAAALENFGAINARIAHVITRERTP
jgi:hypothetical protein